jgi:PadR family transcriptional regulator PadR
MKRESSQDSGAGQAAIRALAPPIMPDLTIPSKKFTLCEEMDRQLLTDFELMILLAILRLRDEAYAVRIGREIETTAGRAVLLPAVYAALERLERNALLASSMGQPTPERGGRAKRYFRVTGSGLRAVKETQRALVALWSDVPELERRRS